MAGQQMTFDEIEADLAARLQQADYYCWLRERWVQFEGSTLHYKGRGLDQAISDQLSLERNATQIAPIRRQSLPAGNVEGILSHELALWDAMLNAGPTDCRAEFYHGALRAHVETLNRLGLLSDGEFRERCELADAAYAHAIETQIHRELNGDKADE